MTKPVDWTTLLTVFEALATSFLFFLRFCEVEFQGPLSIQEEWVRHLQRHILEMNFSKADPLPEEPQAPQAQTAAVEAP